MFTVRAILTTARLIVEKQGVIKSALVFFRCNISLHRHRRWMAVKLWWWLMCKLLHKVSDLSTRLLVRHTGLVSSIVAGLMCGFVVLKQGVFKSLLVLFML